MLRIFLCTVPGTWGIFLPEKFVTRLVNSFQYLHDPNIDPLMIVEEYQIVTSLLILPSWDRVPEWRMTWLEAEAIWKYWGTTFNVQS